ncbi:hypothetical protein EV385_2583 [Krasilnikovia cinnamomea]|uniref:PknH-like protein n=1 Tax=Krasilnikovia cinnamomea TaxID=349313 RepID=A0A4Q7ZKT4_9ACTN|nr:hypothetical protein [Krasilnikovia cinnamomea]RZU50799.1 hypothetical protein EV385_2583 [Krasilnikovia cinnamomea]
MSTELRELFGALSADADSVPVLAAEKLRSRADRSGRTRTALAMVALVVVVGGVAAGGRWVFTAGPPTAPAPPAASVAVTTPPAPSQTPQTVPDRAFLTAADTNGSTPDTVPADERSPNLCGARFASNGAIRVTRTARAMYDERNPPPNRPPSGVVEQTVTAYRGAGAADFVREFRSVVGDCARDKRDGQTCRQRLLDAPNVGDEAVLVERRCVVQAPEGRAERRYRVAVVRVANRVTVLSFHGWEGASVDPAQTQQLTRLAAQRLTGWGG